MQQIWLGRADDANALYRVMEEREAFYSLENEDAEGTPAHIALSEFADIMGEESYDHDFLEYGFEKSAGAMEAKFAGHSWVDQWAPMIRETHPEKIWRDANAFILLGVDTYQGRPYPQIRKPVDVIAPGIALRYIGEVTHPSQ